MNELLIVLVSYLFVAGVILVGIGLYMLHVTSKETTRKLIHIGVIHWWIIAMLYLDTTWIALIGPLSFIVINAVNVKYHLLPGIQRDHDHDYGTVYYAVSLSILTFFAFEFDGMQAATIALFVMGYGDGFAALIGKKIPSTKLRHHKSLVGTLTMLVVSFGVSFYITQDVVISIVIGVIASVVELLSPKGLDNLSVPLLVYLVAGVLL
jgi:phytol kinase